MVKKLLLLILLLFASPVWATNYYISAAGDGDCSSGDPCALATAVAAAGSGDTIYFKSDDTWTGQATILTAVAGVTYDGSTYGTGTRATLQATSAASNSAVIRIGVSNVKVTGFEINGGDFNLAGIQVGGYAAPTTDISNIEIDSCVIYNIGNCGGEACTNDTASWSSGIDISPRVEGDGTPHTVEQVLIHNTTVHDTVRNGIAVYPAWSASYNPSGNINDTVTIRNCTIYNAGNNGGLGYAGSGHGVHIKSDSRNVTVDYNTLYDNLGSGIYIESFYNDSTVAPTNMIVRYNLMYNNGHGISLLMNETTGSATGAFYGNVLYNNTSEDVSLGGSFNDSVISFYNNTIYTTVTGTFGAFHTEVMTGASTLNLKNNIIVTASRPPLTFCWNNDADNCSATLTHNNNLYYRSSGETGAHITVYKYGTNEATYDRDGTASDLTNWETSGAQKTDPAFSGGTLPTGFSGTYGSNMVPNTDYFQLTTDSPAKDTGATLASYTGAINGAGLATPIVRPLGDAFDIGAYEYGTVAQSGGSAGSGFFLQGVTIR